MQLLLSLDLSLAISICYQANRRKNMFEISDETKANAIAAIKEVLRADGVHDIHLTDDVLGRAFDAAVAAVKAQFGM